MYTTVTTKTSLKCLLNKLIKPHLLRRAKEDVEHTLPGMKETLLYVEITNLQKMCYRAVLERNRELLLRNISRRANVSDIVYIHALAGANATATVRLSGAEGKLGEETGAACMPGAACTRSMEAVALDDFFERIGAA